MRVINIPTETISMSEIILSAQRLANAADGYHARQHEGTYGHLDAALRKCLAIGIVGNDSMAVGADEWAAARKIVDGIMDVVIDSGECIQYAIDWINSQYPTLCSHGFDVLGRCPVAGEYGCTD